jgi:hypothetical protein
VKMTRSRTRLGCLGSFIPSVSDRERQFHSVRERPGKADGMAAAVTTPAPCYDAFACSSPRLRSDLRDVLLSGRRAHIQRASLTLTQIGRQWLRDATVLPPPRQESGVAESPHVSNHLLASLGADELAALLPHLKAVDLPQETVLFESGDAIKTVYFPQIPRYHRTGRVHVSQYFTIFGGIAMTRKTADLKRSPTSPTKEEEPKTKEW